MMRRMVYDTAAICAAADSKRAPRWKNTLITVTPATDCDSICSTRSAPTMKV